MRIFPSLSFLIHNHISFNREHCAEEFNGYELIDSPDTIYFFGCCRDGIDETFATYDRYSVTPRDKILTTIFAAEKEDRVRWRKYDPDMIDDSDRIWLQNKTGVFISKEDAKHIRNLPLMKEFFSRYPHIRYMF